MKKGIVILLFVAVIIGSFGSYFLIKQDFERVKEVKDIQPRVRLRKGNSSNRLLVKQLLASAWLGIPYGSAEILPKNRDEEDVRLENLEVVPFPTT